MTHSSGVPSNALQDDAVEATISNPNSQDSSFAETSTSQRSQLGPSSTGLPELFQLGAGREALTPSTSLSNYSIQENAVNGRRGINGSQVAEGERDIAPSGPMIQMNATTENSRNEPKIGLKRTATGQIKSPLQGSLPTSPVDSSMYGHSRNTSTTSRSSQIGEISSKLQARMSYAKVKVQHGWENHSISELEHMTSNQGSPVPTSSYTAREYETSPANYSPVDLSLTARAPWQASTNAAPEYLYSSPQRQAAARSSGNPHKNSPASDTTTMPTAQPNETYEQFWQSHSNTTIPQRRGKNMPPLNGPSLAPPVEFSPRNTAPTKQKPRPLHTNKPFPGRLPSTPPPRGSALAKLRTPSQQAAVEQDALEGLLSMNSPANSQNLPATRGPPRSPLYSQTAPSVVLNGVINGTSVPFLGPAQRPRAPRELNDDEINKMLDEMPDSSSSDEDDLVERVLGS